MKASKVVDVLPDLRDRGLGLGKQWHKQLPAVPNLKVHLVFVPEYRRKTFTSEGLDLIGAAFENVADKMGSQVLEFGEESEHDSC